MHNFTPRIFLVVGSPGSGKDELMTAVNTIGSLHAEIVPKHTCFGVRWRGFCVVGRMKGGNRRMPFWMNG